MSWSKAANLIDVNKEELFWCTNCVMMSTRPRITFNKKGMCNACEWSIKKKNINWSKRKKSLLNLLKKHKKNDGNFDCLVPCSGGKDGSYVAYQLKHKFKMNPLCITVNPPLRLEIGEKNLKSFINSGYELISVDCDQESMREINKAGFIEMGSPYYGWLVSIHTAVAKIASQMNINLVFYGEDGEIEYGGTKESEKKPIYDYKYQKKFTLKVGMTKY